MAYESFFTEADRSVTPAEYEQLATPLGTSGLVGYTGTKPVFGDSTGRQVKIRSGVGALIRGYRFNTTSETVVDNTQIAANSSGQTRIDLLVLRLRRTESSGGAGDAYTIAPYVIAGTPAASPIAPQPVRDVPLTATGVYDLPLAEITVINGATTITAAQVVNRAWWIAPAGYTGFDAAKPPPEPNALFRANDTGITYVGTSGGSWQTIYRDSGWQTITPASGWTHVYSGMRVRRMGNIVVLSMGVRRTGATVGATTVSTIGTVPTGYRPDGIDALGTYSISTTDTISDMVVRTTGQIVLQPTFNSSLQIYQNAYCVANMTWIAL